MILLLKIFVIGVITFLLLVWLIQHVPTEKQPNRLSFRHIMNSGEPSISHVGKSKSFGNPTLAQSTKEVPVVPFVNLFFMKDQRTNGSELGLRKMELVDDNGDTVRSAGQGNISHMAGYSGSIKVNSQLEDQAIDYAKQRQHIKPDAQEQTQNRVASSAHYENSAAALPPKQGASESLFAGNIVMDWISDSDTFGYINYRSLESLLMRYPLATITVHLIAPDGADYYKLGSLISKHYLQKYKKFGYNVSIKVVYKRIKDRNDGRALPSGAEYWNQQLIECCSYRAAVDINRDRFIPIHMYFYRRFLSLHTHGGLYSDFSWYHLAPIDLLKWDMPTGNITREFSGAIIKQVCTEVPIDDSTDKRLMFNQDKEQKPPYKKCYTSTLMAFSKGNPVTNCMLHKYDAMDKPENTFGQCIAAAVGAGATAGATAGVGDEAASQCVQQALRHCFLSTGQRNDFIRNSEENKENTSTDQETGGMSDSSGAGDRGDTVAGNHSGSTTGDSCDTDWMDSVHHRQAGSYWNSHSAFVLHRNNSSCSPGNIAPAAAESNERVHCSQHTVNMMAMCELNGGDGERYHQLVWGRDKELEEDAGEKDRGLSATTNHEGAGAGAGVGAGSLFTTFVVSAFGDGEAVTAEIERSNVMWLGPGAYSKDWLIPDPLSVLGRILSRHELPLPSQQHRADVLFFQVNSSTTEIPGKPSEIGYIPSSALMTKEADKFQRFLDVSSIADRSILQNLHQQQLVEAVPVVLSHDPATNTSVLALKQPACHHYNLTGENAPHSLHRQAASSCAPLFVIPGFMKAGTTAMFSAIMTHPQMVNALRGVSFKETGCYLPDFARRTRKRKYNRMHCFPFVQERERVYFGDGTIWYANQRDVPGLLMRDNPDIKVLFTIRDPIKRTESHHRFAFPTLQGKGIGDINGCIDLVLNRSLGNIMKMHDLASGAVQEHSPLLRKEKIQRFFELFYNGVVIHAKGPLGNLYRAAMQLVTHSIYLPALHHWYHSIPRGNMRVVTSEDYNPSLMSAEEKLSYIRAVERDSLGAFDMINSTYSRAMQNTARMESDSPRQTSALKRITKALDKHYMVHRMNDIYRFLGLPPVDNIPPFDTHSTGDKFIQTHQKLNAVTRKKLEEFYRPFMLLVQDFLEESF